jgi:hypothetical protein
MISFKQFFKESPDLVYNPKTGTALKWFKEGAIAFGTVHGWKNITPFFIQSLDSSLSHFEMIQNVAIKLELAYEKNKNKEGEELEEVFERTLMFDKLWKLSTTAAASRLARELLASENLMHKIKTKTFLDWLRAFTYSDDEEYEGLEFKDPVRTQLYKNTGRVWPEEKVISFWLSDDQLTPQILDSTFQSLRITDKDKYFIDVINLKELDKEESKDKQLPSYEVYKSRKSGTSQPVSDEERKKVQELMSKQHGVAGAQKAKFQDKSLPEVGAKKYAKQMPLDIRQRVTTSESLADL